jgi:hypothetical protein
MKILDLDLMKKQYADVLPHDNSWYVTNGIALIAEVERLAQVQKQTATALIDAIRREFEWGKRASVAEAELVKCKAVVEAARCTCDCLCVSDEGCASARLAAALYAYEESGK